MSRGRKPTRMTFKASCDVRYRYTCDNCACETEWFDSCLEEDTEHVLKATQFEVKGGHDPEQLEMTKKEALRRLELLVSIFQEKIGNITGTVNFPGAPHLPTSLTAHLHRATPARAAKAARYGIRRLVRKNLSRRNRAAMYRPLRPYGLSPM